MPDKKKRRPNTKTLQRVFEYLDELGLSVYGAYINVDTGQMYGGCKDYTVEEVIKLDKLIANDELWKDDDV